MEKKGGFLSNMLTLIISRKTLFRKAISLLTQLNKKNMFLNETDSTMEQLSKDWCFIIYNLT